MLINQLIFHNLYQTLFYTIESLTINEFKIEERKKESFEDDFLAPWSYTTKYTAFPFRRQLSHTNIVHLLIEIKGKDQLLYYLRL